MATSAYVRVGVSGGVSVPVLVDLDWGSRRMPDEAAARGVGGLIGLRWTRWAEDLIEAEVEIGRTVLLTEGAGTGSVGDRGIWVTRALQSIVIV